MAAARAWRTLAGRSAQPLCLLARAPARELPAAPATRRLGYCLGAAVAGGLWVRPTSCDDGARAASPPLHVVLDVDETLVHSQQVHPAVLGAQQQEDTFALELQEGVAIQVSKRPGLDGFLQWLRKRGYQVSLYTAGTRRYVEALLPALDPEGIISQCLAREDCLPAPGLPNVYLKDLRRVMSLSTGPDGTKKAHPANLARTVLVDNNPVSFAMQPSNGILVKDWLGGTVDESPDDSEFERVKALLLKLEAAPQDVRELLPHFQKSEARKFTVRFATSRL